MNNISWKQKKEIMSGFIHRYYADTLLKEGFVSYKDAGFNWFKVKNGLLYSIRMPIFEPAQPLYLNIGYGIIPMFSWTKLVYTAPMRDWQLFHEYFVEATGRYPYEVAKRVLGEMPRSPWIKYCAPKYVYEYDNILIMHWMSENTEKKGVEIIEEIILPLLERINTIDSLYSWHKKNRMLKDIDHQTEVATYYTEQEYYALLNEPRKIRELTHIFAEECLYCQDKAMYPYILQYLEQRPQFLGSPKTNKEKEELAAEKEHERVLIQVIKTDDRDLLKEELYNNRERMIKQIKKTLPNLSLDSLELLL